MSFKKYILNWFLYLILFFLFFIALKSNGQSQSPKPHEQINVQKETDENGNIIRFDSTYSLSYSGSGGNINADSLFRNIIGNFPFDFDFDDDFQNPYSLPDFSTHFDHDLNFLFSDDYFKSFDETLKEQEKFVEKILQEENIKIIPDSKPQNFYPVKKNKITGTKI